MDDDTQDLIAEVGKAAITGPEGCYSGIPEEAAIPQGAHVLGVEADTQEDLSEVVGETDREPIFMAEVKVLCGV